MEGTNAVVAATGREPPISALDRLRALIGSDPAEQARLATIDDGAVFLANIAARHDIHLGAAEAALLTDPDSLGLDRFQVKPPTHADWPDPAWLPSAVAWGGEDWTVEWKHFGGARLTDPFFETTLRRVRRRPLNALLSWQTPLAQLAGTAPGELPVPDGFIFHMSRCGSTLVAQMAAALDNSLVVSEAPPLDALLQISASHRQGPGDADAAALRALVGALGRTATGRRARYIVKLDSWHIIMLPLFRRAFPDVPWIFLHRDPAEVMVSQMRCRGPQTMAGAMDAIYGIDAAMSEEEHIACVLGRICKAAVDHASLGDGLMIDYADLPGAAADRILPHFGVQVDRVVRTTMSVVANRDAKATERLFTDDRASKQAEANIAIHAAIAAHTTEPYARIRAIGREQLQREPVA